MRIGQILSTTVVVLALIPSGRGLGQSAPVLTVPPEPTCRTCSIELTKVATLGQSTDSVLLREFVGVIAVNSRGEYFALVGAFQIAVYDSGGRLLRVLGRSGRGPGELTQITDIRVIAGDSLLVNDAVNGPQLFTPDFRFVRPIRIPRSTSLALAVVRPDASIILQALPHELRIISPAGVVAGTVPVQTTPGATGCRRCDERWLSASSKPGMFWSTISNRYDIEMLDTTGRVHRTLSRRPSWFTPWTSVPRGPGTERLPPHPVVSAIRESPDGVLWVRASIADANWKYDASRNGASIPYDSTYDVMLAAIDPVTGALLAERRLPTALGFIGADRAFTVTQDADGYVSAQIWRVELKRR